MPNRPFALSITMPGSTRAVASLHATTRTAAAALRRFARQRGVSVLALDWSATPVAPPERKEA